MDMPTRGPTELCLESYIESKLSEFVKGKLPALSAPESASRFRFARDDC